MASLYFWRHSQVKKIPHTVVEELGRRFLFTERYIASLRCVERAEIHQGRLVTRFRIFDPRLVDTLGQPVRSYDDLNSGSESLKYEGYIEQNGRVYLADRRSPRKTEGIHPAHDNSTIGNNGNNSVNINKIKLASYGPGAGLKAMNVDDEGM